MLSYPKNLGGKSLGSTSPESTGLHLVCSYPTFGRTEAKSTINNSLSPSYLAVLPGRLACFCFLFK